MRESGEGTGALAALLSSMLGGIAAGATRLVVVEDCGPRAASRGGTVHPAA